MKTLRRSILALAIVAFVAACTRPREETAAAPAPPPKSRVAATRPDAPPAPPPSSSPRVPTGEAINDSMITARIKAGIVSDPNMAGSDVSVNTDRGVVSLTGIIKSQEQAAIASALAQRQDGVMRVDNQLAVNLH